MERKRGEVDGQKERAIQMGREGNGIRLGRGGGCYSGVTKTGEMHLVCTAPGGRKPKIGLNSN